jgi:transcriptional regulator with PAS, ATPase and Fis domain
MEAELFGVEKGSFTGASSDKKGIFETAGHGTVFLDEVHTLSLSAQQKLLRVLQEKKVRPVGSTREYQVHFRLVAAAKPGLEDAVKTGDFLQDLYFRLNVLRIEVPSLRHRPEDIAPLVYHFIQSNREEGKAPKQILVRAVRYLEKYSWPGNVRELENTIESICATVSGDRIGPDELGAKFFEEQSAAPRTDPQDITREALVAAVQGSRSIRDAAFRLGVPKSTLYDLARRYGIETGRKRQRAI